MFSLFQYDRWHRRLVSELDVTPDDTILDVCTGTGLVATRLAEAERCRVVGVDLSRPMLEQGRRSIEAAGLSRSVGIVEGRAEGLPFADGTFDAVVFTFLLRYVADPEATIAELARVLRPA